MELTLKNSIVLKRGSRLLILLMLIAILIVALSMAMVFLFFYDFSSLDTNTFFPTVIMIILAVFAVSMLLQIVFFKLFGGGKIVGIYSMGITELCFSKVMKRNTFFAAHFLTNFVPLIAFIPFAILFWNGIMFFALCAVFGNLAAYTPLYMIIMKHDSDDLFRFEIDGVLRVYTLST